jgi:hypothetical protein
VGRTDLEADDNLLAAFRGDNGVEAFVKTSFIGREVLDIDLRVVAAVEDGTWVFVDDRREKFLKETRGVGDGIGARELNTSARAMEQSRNSIRGRCRRG